MTIKELKEKLEILPENAKIIIGKQYATGNFSDAEDVFIDNGGKFVFITDFVNDKIKVKYDSKRLY